MQMFRIPLMLVLFTGFAATTLFAQQQQVDSLQNLLNTTRGTLADSARIRIAVRTSELLLRIDPVRSLDLSKEALRLSIVIGFNNHLSHIYNNIGTANRLQGKYVKSLSFHNKALENDRKKGNRKAEALSLNNVGNIYLVQGRYKDAVSNYERSLRIRQDINDEVGVASSLNNLGLVYKNQGDLDRALAYYQNAYKIFEQIKDRVGFANALNNIGIIYRNNGNRERALLSFVEALKVFQEIGNKVGEANTLNNIGNIYYQQEKFEQALELYTSSHLISEALGNKNSMAGELSNIGGVHLILGNKEKALEFTEKALDLQTEIGNDKGQISTLNNLGAYFLEEMDLNRSLSYFTRAEKIERRIGDHSYSTITLSSIGEIYSLKDEPQEGLRYLKKALKEARNYGSTEDIIKVYASLSDAYADAGDFKLSYDYQQLAVDVRDSLDRVVNARDLAEMQTRFETEQKQREIELLGKEKEVQDLKMTKQIVIRNTVMVISVFALLMLALIYTRYRTKKKANEALDRKNREIEQQKKTVEEKNTEITSSIEYAKRIQDAMMPSMAEIHTTLPDSFVFYRPKEIVSGDFYWYAKDDDRSYIAAVDCTGHGVPGAFMSMIGNDHLNQIVNVEHCRMPDQILNRLHHEIQVTLKQKHGVTDIHDGMDIALCVINHKQKKLYFSSANRYLYQVRNKELTEIKGDHFNIGGIMHEDVRHYDLHEIDLQKGDAFYIFSDGVSDQFGGERGKKFGYLRLKEMLLSMHDRPMEKQRDLYEKTITEWMGDDDQIDDLLLIGIRV